MRQGAFSFSPSRMRTATTRTGSAIFLPKTAKNPLDFCTLLYYCHLIMIMTPQPEEIHRG
jgi:hypothetical protein